MIAQTFKLKFNSTFKAHFLPTLLLFSGKIPENVQFAQHEQNSTESPPSLKTKILSSLNLTID